MSAPEITIRQAESSDLMAICALLQESGLPVSDLSCSKIVHFCVAFTGSELLGVAGLEPVGPVALLRSVTVLASLRGQGLGSGLISFCEQKAERENIRTLYLIPNDDQAEALFTRRGFSRIARQQLPPAVRALPEFTHLCPDTHPCLSKSLPGTPD